MRVLVLVILTLLLPDIFIMLVHQSGWPLIWRMLWWLPTLATVVCICHFFRRYDTPSFTFTIAILLCVAMPKLLFSTFSILGLAISWAWPPASSIFNILGAIAGMSFAMAMLYGFLFGWKKMKVHRVNLEFENLPPSFHGYKIVQLSDLHVGSFSKSTKYLEEMVGLVNQLDADTIVFTGDLVNTTADEVQPFLPTLSELKAHDGVLSILGNHDYPWHVAPDQVKAGGQLVAEMERRMGWHVLLNEHHILSRGDDHIAFIGVENIGLSPFSRFGSLRDAREGLSGDVFPILLSHDPAHWRVEVLPDTDIPLMLSGHTHAGQLRIGRWSPASTVTPECSGLYQQGQQMLYVNQGIGARVHFRFGTYAEITLLTLYRKA